MLHAIRLVTSVLSSAGSSKLWATALAASGIAATAQAQWRAAPLQPAGATASRASCVSAAAQAGAVQINGATRAAVWPGTTDAWIDVTPAGTPSGAILGGGGGQFVGVSFGAKAVLWTGDPLTCIQLDPQGISSEALGSDGVHQVGDSIIPGAVVPCMWTGTAESRVILRPIAVHTTFGKAFAVAGDQQVGFVQLPPGVTSHASLWRGDADSWVDLHPIGALSSCAYAVGGGRQAGYVAPTASALAAVWRGTRESLEILHPAAGYSESCVTAVDDRHEVGSASTGRYSHAAIWRGTADSFVDLHRFLPPEYLISWATGVRTDGPNVYVSGVARTDSFTPDVAFLWIYCAADFNADGFSDFFDYAAFLADFESGAPAADFNADGFTDFFDYADFVAAFESGC